MYNMVTVVNTTLCIWQLNCNYVWFWVLTRLIVVIVLQYVYTRSVQKVSNHVMWKIETFIEEDTRYKKHCKLDKDTSVPLKYVPWDLTQFSQSLSAAPLYFPESHLRSEISFLSKVILVLGKARSSRATNLSHRGSWVTWVIWCFSKKNLHGMWCMSGHVVVMKLLITSCT